MQLEPLSSVGCRSGVLRLAACLAVCTVLVLVAPSPAAAQMMMNSTDHLSFDRPESWALKYFTSATLVGGLETPRTQKPGSVSIGLEVGWLPRLTAPQLGSVQGAYTCPARTVAFEPGSVGNPDGCQAASSDKATLRYAGGEASVAYRPDAPYRLSPHAAIGLAYMNVGFQVNALTFGMIDHTHYLSHGMAVFASGGLSYRLTSRLILSTDVFYSPLSVRRGFGAPAQNDGLFNIRTLVTYRMR